VVSTCDLGGKVFPSNKQRDGTKSVLVCGGRGQGTSAVWLHRPCKKFGGGKKKRDFKEERASAAALQGGKKKEKSGRNVPVLYVTDWMIGAYGARGGEGRYERMTVTL